MDPEFHYSFGFRCDISRCVTFYDETTLLFLSGRLCILFDLDTRKQKLLQFSDQCEISVITRCENHLVAGLKSSPPSLCLYNILSATKKNYSGLKKPQQYEYICLSVSLNLKFIAAQESEPDWTLVIWLSQTREIVATFNPTATKPVSIVHDISFHDGGRDEIVIVGKSILRLYEYQKELETEEEISFVEHIFEKHEERGEYTSISWPQKENLAVSTLNGKILFFRGIEQIYEIEIFNVFLQELTNNEVNEEHITRFGKSVYSLIAMSSELFCVFSGKFVIMYRGEEINQYKLSKVFLIPPRKMMDVFPGEVSRNDDILTSLHLNSTGSILVSTTDNGQLLFLNCNDAGNFSYFSRLIDEQHKEPIIGMDVAKCRPIIATCSEQSVILWNYESKSKEMYKKFKDQILSIAIHPTGLYLAVGFLRYSRICSILYRGLKEYKLVLTTDCSRIDFSSNGHLLAVVNDLAIEIYCFINLTLLAKLKGHAGQITCCAWKDQDTRLITCDARGVICEWDLLTWNKLWENTNIFPYSSVVVSSVQNNILAVGSDKTLRCIAHSRFLWEVSLAKELTAIVPAIEGTTFYIADSNGCLQTLCVPTPANFMPFQIFAHNDRISEMKSDFSFSFLITAGYDGMLLCWLIAENRAATCHIFSDLSFISVQDIERRKERIEQLRLSFKRGEKARQCELRLSDLRHDEILKRIDMEHEQILDALNEKIAVIKEEMQIFIFDSFSEVELNAFRVAKIEEIVAAKQELDKAYILSATCAEENLQAVKKFETIIDSLEKEYKVYETTELNRKVLLQRKIKKLEIEIMVAKDINHEIQKTCENYRNNMCGKITAEADPINGSQKEMMKNEKSKTLRLQNEVKKLKKLVSLLRKDTLQRRNITAEKVDFEIDEKMRVITVLKTEYQQLVSKLEAGDKIIQNQEVKFFEMRKSIGSLQRGYLVSKTAIRDLKNEINAKETEIELSKTKIKEITKSLPQLEDEIHLTRDLCYTLSEKVKETVDGFHHKQKILRNTQDLISKYMSVLHECTSQNCDAIQLRDDILQLFEQCKSGAGDDVLDPNLKDEFNCQILKLEKSYNEIKGEPAKAMREQSFAEFRLSRENSKLLQEVYEIQEKVEDLRRIIFEMEMALGLYHSKQAKSTKHAEELRRKIEFVVDAVRTNREEKIKKMKKLDALIEEQQKEMLRLQRLIFEKKSRRPKEKPAVY
ncbi:cilia- and flagella-associated protein 57-like [Stegodyphus dumicola]|uniref:cilia- and flagella-associated protein 57-like n=1 Tax=Stegodyphus dumicola TaxID=202533 RepID=UPI0015B1D741|nr:cilia- and flagella-associated protein 57-like [Stegodyphus dumicola]